MEEVTLSGGNFGGTKLPLSSFIDNKVELEDESGKWEYDISLSASPAEAVFSGMK